MRSARPTSTAPRPRGSSASRFASCATACSASGSKKIAPDRIVASPNCDARPAGVAVSLLVIHSISLPPGEYGGPAIEQLFTNCLDPAAHPYFEQIRGLRVSSHYLIRRSGELVQFVAPEMRAWHAGASAWRGRNACNDYSIGVELEGTDDAPFEDAQYATLAALVRALRERFPLKHLAAHSDVAPGRKTDPGARFDWPRLLAALAAPNI